VSTSLATRNRGIPSYRLHKPSGRAVVTIAGRDHYLGEHGSVESRAEYDRLIAEWLANGRAAPRADRDELTVSELILAYWRYAEPIYPPRTLDTFRAALRHLRKLYGHTAADEFGPLSLRTLQRHLTDLRREDGASQLSRKTINQYTARIRQVFKWGAAEGLVDPGVWQALSAVDGLRRGRTTARETAPVRPVDDITIEVTLRHLPPMVADMVRIQRLTGMRPGELCAMTTADVDCSADVWLYTPQEHKTEHHGHERVIAIGPRAQEVLKPYLSHGLMVPVFSPRKSEQVRRGSQAEDLSPLLGDQYTVDAYRRAVHRACKKAGVARWSPNQLRHTRATELRKGFGLDTAGAVLGHRKLETSQVYAERSMEAAVAAARKTG